MRFNLYMFDSKLYSLFLNYVFSGSDKKGIMRNTVYLNFVTRNIQGETTSNTMRRERGTEKYHSKSI